MQDFLSLSRLELLNFEGNKISEFSLQQQQTSSQKNLPKLQQLILSHNQLISFPPNVSMLISLVCLKLDHNSLKFFLLPPSESDSQPSFALPHLEELWLNHNQLTCLSPVDVGRSFPLLKILKLDENPQLADFPDSFFSQTQLTILTYINTQLTQKTLSLLPSFQLFEERRQVHANKALTLTTL
eukprot:TRINITY_DN2104_c0_g1_i1.p1 TRINITY_DN2104_c0_g1~~TRINITY_DN2104_c0_g1_i1.p1  ORF type:complete len:184 (+),score=33.24 TRINITY_DN2104_c0_g1_i1:382-933(+)